MMWAKNYDVYGDMCRLFKGLLREILKHPTFEKLINNRYLIPDMR
jgi:hypothetical protein